ncbi:MAG: serpin family protein, partial [Chloroflexi bacterium]|nr:serpin family protein [Chloroflexota bacterium]
MVAGCGGSETASPSPEEPSPTAPISPDPSPAGFQLAKSEMARVAAPDVLASELDELVAGNDVFAFDLYQVLQAKDGNLFFSPYSISTALAMTYAGARTETEKQMAETLKFTLPQDKLHSGFNALDLRLANEGGADGFTLRIANSLWGQDGYPF